jgi:glycerol kinase
LFDDQGSVRSVAQREFTQIFPQPGWVEHDPQEIAASQMAVAIEVLEKAGVQRGEVAAIGIANQRETTIVWERERQAGLQRHCVAGSANGGILRGA